MKKILQIITISIMLILVSVLTGCTTTTPIMECESPLIYSGDRCCLDADTNGICDVDEQNTKIDNKGLNDKELNKELDNTELNKEKTTNKINSQQIDVNQQVDMEKDIEQSKKSPTKADAEQVAQLFVDKWNVKSYNLMYNLIAPELKAKKSATEFQTILKLESMYRKVEKIEFTGSSVTDGANEGTVNIILYTNVQEIKIPSLKLVYIDGNWRIHGFSDIFDLDTFEAACGGFRHDARYTTEECAKDFAISMDDSNYCNQSGCFYEECMEKTGQTLGIQEKATSCKLCPNLHDSISECILDLAVKEDKLSICDYISDRKYSDRYCTCYGGFALAKNAKGYCNNIEDEEYRYLCEKKADGQSC